MRRFLIIVFSLFALNSGAQYVIVNGWQHAGGGGGSDLTVISTNTSTSSNNVTSPSLTSVPAGSLLVITTANADSRFQTTGTVITSSPSLTWTKRAETPDNAGGSGMAEIWTAVYSAGGNITVTSTWQSVTTATSSVLYAVGNVEATLSGNSANAVDQSFPSVSITTTRTNSIIFCVSSDYAATAGTVSYDASTILELDHDLSPGTYRGYHYRKAATSTGSYTAGLTAPTGQSAGTCVLEIRRANP